MDENKKTDDFFSKASDALNDFVGSIEKRLKGLDKDGEKVERKTTFENPFKKKDEAEAPAAKTRVYDIPASRVDAGDTITIVCEVPGCERANLKLDYDKDSIIVKAVKKAPEIPENASFREDDRRYGQMERRFRVGKVDATTIHASFKDGLLTVTCTRPAPSEGVGITIE
jgi:HSP20 family protein